MALLLSLFLQSKTQFGVSGFDFSFGTEHKTGHGVVALPKCGSQLGTRIVVSAVSIPDVQVWPQTSRR